MQGLWLSERTIMSFWYQYVCVMKADTNETIIWLELQTLPDMMSKSIEHSFRRSDCFHEFKGIDLKFFSHNDCRWQNHTVSASCLYVIFETDHEHEIKTQWTRVLQMPLVMFTVFNRRITFYTDFPGEKRFWKLAEDSFLCRWRELLVTIRPRMDTAAY